MPEGRLYRSMLLDYYGELLTERQRECYDLHYNEDLSLSEIAEQCGISRQGVWDNIRRAEESLERIEDRTGLIRRSRETEQRIRRVQGLLGELKEQSYGAEREKLEAAEQELQELLKEESGL